MDRDRHLPKPLFEIYRDGKLIRTIYEKVKYGNKKNRRVIKTIYDIEGKRIDEEISKGSICILRRKYSALSLHQLTIFNQKIILH